LRLTGLYRRAQRNAADVRIRRNMLHFPRLPQPFDGYTILQISDLHVDISAPAMRRLAELLGEVGYDLCVLTGDYRGKTFGPIEPTLDGLGRIRDRLRGAVYAVLGNHDSLRMVPAMEEMGIRVLLNETATIRRDSAALQLAGIDDAHYYRMDNIEKAASAISAEDFAILLSHTPEIYRQAAHAGFDLMLSGHTHGGQLCLPGAVPLTLEAKLPRRLGSGAWRYHRMQGYTSVGVGTCILPVRLNCPPEITLHHLHCE
jgi:predicted MPP superfamily phosphohydrolase